MKAARTKGAATLPRTRPEAAREAPRPVAGAEPLPLGARVGRIVGLDETTVPQVDFPGNPHGPLAARVALSPAQAERLVQEWQSLEVLLVFANQDVRQPVVSGLVTRTLREAYDRDEQQQPRQLVLRASEELVLECGDAKIALRDGKIVIIGREILSRAQERHRIRGATVAIN
jgi:hypothetical protein